MTNFHKNILQRGNTNAVAIQLQILQLFVKRGEELFEIARVFVRDLNRHF